MKFKNQEYYEKVRARLNKSGKPFPNKSNWLIYLFVAVFSIAIAPLLAVRRGHIMPTSVDVYFSQVKFFAGASVLIILPLLWVIQFKPYLEMKGGYYYLGRFKIVEKKQLLGCFFYLLLFPGRKNWIKVSHKTFYSCKIGEGIELKRALFGSINGVKIFRNVRQRIRGNYWNRCRKEPIGQVR